MSRIERMRRGDRAALQEVLQDHGAALARFVAAMDVNVDDAIVAVWKATVVAPASIDERAFLLTRAAVSSATSRRETGVPDTDVVDYVRLVAELATGLGDDLDREQLEEQAVDEALQEQRARIERAIADSLAEDGPLPELEAAWTRIEPRLT